MSDHSKRRTLELPAEIIAELHAANAKHVADCDGFNGGKFQLWTTVRGPLLVLLTPDDDDAVFFEPSKVLPLAASEVSAESFASRITSQTIRALKTVARTPTAPSPMKVKIGNSLRNG